MNLLYQILITPIERVMEVLLSGIYEVTGSYGVAIFFLSLLINVALLPLFQLAERWQEAERKIQKTLKPKVQEFREAFSGEERHAMIHTLYRQAGYHPIYAMRCSMGLLLQLPFWIAAYQLLSRYQPLNGASFLLFDDLGKSDGLLAGLNLLPFVMTFLNLAGAFLYTRNLSRTEQIQPLVLASLFLVLLYSAPAGLLLYWTLNSLFSLLRIALLNPRLARTIQSEGQCISARLNLLTSLACTWSVPACSAGNAAAGERCAPTQPTRKGGGKNSPSLIHPLIFNLLLFLLVAVIQACLHNDYWSNQGRLFEKGSLASGIAGGASIVMLAYLCCSAVKNNGLESEKDLRNSRTTVSVWILLVVFVFLNIVWLAQASPGMHPARTGGAILLLLFVLLFASPICNGVSPLKHMPNSHWLYAVSISLTAFVLFGANPLNMYASSRDFVGGIYGVAGPLLVMVMSTVFALSVLYWIVDKAARNGLALLTVFLAVIVVAYSAMGVKYCGVMSWFLLPNPRALLRTGHEVAAEVVSLFVMFGMTSYVAIKHRQNVIYVVSSMLVASMGVTAADVYGAKGAVVAAREALPRDHADIVSFSRERNVLIIMLDGFPGAYVQRIMDEVPEVLKEYEGFIWYPNTLATSADTLGAIAPLAGGPQYSMRQIDSRNYDSVESAIREAYHVYVNAFVPKGYQVSYANPAYVECDRLDERIHCADTSPYGLYYRDKEEPDAPLLQGDSHLPTILAMVSLFKASPLFLKSWLYDEGNYRGANSIFVRRKTANSMKAKGWGFLRVLARESNADSGAKTFKFIQLEIPHEPYALNRDCKLQPEKSTVFTESTCALKEIGALLAWMKQSRIYDLTKIVVVSDHGWYVDNPMMPAALKEKLPLLHGWMPMPGVVQPLMLVKDFEAKGDLHRSDTFLSNADVPAIVCPAAGGCGGIGPDPIANSLESRKLFFDMRAFLPEEENATEFSITASFEVRDSIFGVENWTRVK